MRSTGAHHKPQTRRGARSETGDFAGVHSKPARSHSEQVGGARHLIGADRKRSARDTNELSSSRAGHGIYDEAHVVAQPRLSASERLKRKTRPTNDGCRLWTGLLHADGYGRLRFNNKMWLAHRLAWTIEKGTIPDDQELKNVCGDKTCISTNHWTPFVVGRPATLGDA